LQDYDFVLQHIPGKTNTKADILSRKEQVNTKEDNKDVQLLKDEIWTRKTTVKIMMLGRKVMIEESDIVKKIWRNNTREKEIIQALEKKDGLAWKEDGMAYMEGRIYVPNNKKLRKEILKEHHNPVDIGHSGQHQMLELLKRITGGQDSKKISRNMCKDVLNVNKINSSTNEEQVNYIH